MTDPTNNDIPVQFPSYQPPKGIPVATRDQSKPLQKLVSRMFKGPRKMSRVPHGTKSPTKKHQVKFY